MHSLHAPCIIIISEKRNVNFSCSVFSLPYLLNVLRFRQIEKLNIFHLFHILYLIFQIYVGICQKYVLKWRVECKKSKQIFFAAYSHEHESEACRWHSLPAVTGVFSFYCIFTKHVNWIEK